MDLTKINFHESDKLVGHKNYLVWAFKVEQIFIRENVWDVINPSAASPEPVRAQPRHLQDRLQQRSLPRC